MTKFIKTNLPLIILLIVGTLLRFSQVTEVPPSLNWDEVSHGYNAYSLLQTGKDEWGVRFPLIFRAFGDYKLPLYIYLTIPPIVIFGLNSFAIRFVSILAGSFAILGLYLLANVLLSQRLKISLRKKEYEINPGLVAAFLLVLNPWHFFISRPALEANLGLTLFVFALWSLLKGLNDSRYWLLSSILFSATLHTYNSYRVLIPLLLPSFFLLYRTKIKLNKSLLISMVIFLGSLSLMGYQFIAGTGTARYNKLTILTEPAIYQIGQNRLNSKLPSPLPRLIHNRPVYFASQATKNYLGHFSPTFLYQTRGAQYQFAIPGKNLLTLPVTLLSLLGFVYLLKSHKTKESYLLLLFLLLAPIPSALTSDPPQSLRPTPLIPPLILLATLGAIWVIDMAKSKVKSRLPIGFLTAIYLAALTILSFGRYLHSYLTMYPVTYAQAWQYGYQQAIDYMQEHKKEYERFFIIKQLGEPHIFYAFYSKLDPSHLQPGSDNIRFAKSDWFWTDKIDDTYFINHWQIPTDKEVKALSLESGGEISTTNSLLVTTLDLIPRNAQIVKTIKRPDGFPVFVIVAFQ